jgi:hypothetical protein
MLCRNILEKKKLSNSTEELIDGIPKRSGATLTQEQINKIPMDIIINGFSIKDTILEVLHEYHYAGWFNDDSYIEESELEEIAESIQDAFAIKMKFKQGNP